MIDLGPFKVSPMGLGTWAWGNTFLWGYDKSMDKELQEVFNLVVSSGINLFDTADSYGELTNLTEILKPESRSITLQDAGTFWMQTRSKHHLDF